MNSDKTKNSFFKQLGKTLATFSMLLITASFAFAQEPYVFMEGSVHSFSVTNNPANTFAWYMAVDPYNNVDMDPSTYDLMNGGDKADLTIRFNDMNRTAAELVYLVVRETSPNGCSTRRALQILLEPNNMYFDFALVPNADDCFNYDNNYMAEVQVGMNFKDRNGETDRAIPESRFPLMVSYTVENKTDGLAPVQGNGGVPLLFNYSDINAYVLEVTEAKGELHRTVEYELAITDVVDKYGTHITHDENRRVQIRIMNHLPNTGGLDMTMAYVLTPINYTGGM